MKITLKTLQQKVFTVRNIIHGSGFGSLSSYSQIDADESDTVGDLKKKVQETQGHPVESQKIIYSGKLGDLLCGWRYVRMLICTAL
jgi:UV excision repair protein RAD23